MQVQTVYSTGGRKISCQGVRRAEIVQQRKAGIYTDFRGKRRTAERQIRVTRKPVTAQVRS